MAFTRTHQADGYGDAMADPVLLAMLLSFSLWALGVIIGCLLLYVVIRQGVFHGLRAHTRWVDDGKD